MNESREELSRLQDMHRNIEDAAEHRRHTYFLRTLMEEREARKRLRQEALSHVIKGAAWATIAALATLIWFGFKLFVLRP